MGFSIYFLDSGFFCLDEMEVEEAMETNATSNLEEENEGGGGGSGSHLPSDIELDDLVFDVDFHPTQPYLAAAMITGYVKV